MVTPVDAPTEYVPYIAPPVSDRALDDRLSCAANGSNCFVNQEV